MVEPQARGDRDRGGNLVGKAAFAQIEFATDSPLEGDGTLQKVYKW